MPHRSDDENSLMGESAYDMLSDSIILTSEDDDGSVASVASLDEEDLSSLADAEEEDISGDESIHQPESRGIPEFDGLDSQNLGVGTKESMLLESHKSIEFPEPHYYGDSVSVIRVLEEFSKEIPSELMDDPTVKGEDLRAVVTVRQTMTRPSLDISSEPLRIMYIGNESAKDSIIEKIVSAAAVSNQENPFQRRAGCSFAELDDTVSIESLDTDDSPLNIFTATCTEANVELDERKQSIISLTLDSGLKITSKDKNSLEPSKWRPPHLAVFYLCDTDDLTAKRTRVYARSFMLRHAVPTLFISKEAEFKRLTENLSINPAIPHLCLESRTKSGINKVLRRIPVDLSIFLNLDAGQMNRNLAYITGLYSVEDGYGAVLEDYMEPKHIAEELDRSPKRVSEFWILAVFGLFIAMVATAFTANFSSAGNVANHASLNSHSTISAISTTSTKSLTTKTVGTTTSVLVVPKCAPSAEVGSVVGNKEKAAVNGSDEFKMQVVGDSHIIIRPPHRYALLRKPPKVFVQVKRNNKNITTSLAKLFDGFFALDLNREEAWGIVEVSVWTQSKPIWNQTLEVDFGSPWFKTATWKNAALQTISDAEKSLDVFMKRDATKFVKAQASLVGDRAVVVRNQASALVVKGLSKRAEAGAVVANHAMVAAEQANKIAVHVGKMAAIVGKKTESKARDSLETLKASRATIGRSLESANMMYRTAQQQALKVWKERVQATYRKQPASGYLAKRRKAHLARKENRRTSRTQARELKKEMKGTKCGLKRKWNVKKGKCKGRS